MEGGLGVTVEGGPESSVTVPANYPTRGGLAVLLDDDDMVRVLLADPSAIRPNGRNRPIGLVIPHNEPNPKPYFITILHRNDAVHNR